MRILYYDWDEFNGADCRDAMKRLGHQVDSFRMNMKGYDLTPQIEEEIRKRVTKEEDGKRYYDLLFSFDFFPNISEACQKYGIPYISWVFDCPHYTMDSPNAMNPVNKIYLFDKKLYINMLRKGVNTVRYSPLGVNELRLSELCEKLDKETGGDIVYEHDVCF